MQNKSIEIKGWTLRVFGLGFFILELVICDLGYIWDLGFAPGVTIEVW